MARRARRGRHEGGCSQRSSDGLWVASKSCGTDPQTGKRVRMTAYGTTKTEALERLEELKRQLTSGTLPDARQLTVGQLLTKWLDNLRGRTSARTYEERVKTVRKHVLPRVGRHRLDQFHALHVESLYSELRTDGVKAGAVKAAALYLTTALNYAVRLKLIATSPAAGVRKPSVPRRPMVVLDTDQAKAFAGLAAADPLGCLLLTALGSGCRQGELLALQWDDLNLKVGTLSVTKSLSRTKEHGWQVVPPKSASGTRTIALPRPTVAALVAHKAAALKAGRLDAPVFGSPAGGYQSTNRLRRAVARVVKKLNAAGTVKPVPAGFRFHDLRHSHASVLLSTGHSLRAVSTRLGHRDPALTLRIYAHVLPNDDARLAEGMAAVLG